VVSWAWDTSVVNDIENVGSIALNAISQNFDVSFGAALFNLVFVPAWVWVGDGALSLGGQNEDCKEGEFSNKICHFIN